MEQIGTILSFSRGSDGDCGIIKSANGNSFGFNLVDVGDDELDRILISNDLDLDTLRHVAFTPEHYTNRYGVEKLIAKNVRLTQFERMTPNPPGDESALESVSGARKSLLTRSEQLAHMVSQGINVDLSDANDALEYLGYRNNYFRMRAFRSGFKRLEVNGVSRFAELSFSTLATLSEIDSEARETFLHLTLDIEHAAKMELLRRAEEEECDAYSIVEDFLQGELVKKESAEANGESYRCVDVSHLESARRNDPYVGGLIEHYSNEGYPLWAFLELISFGNLNYLYMFSAKRFSDRRMVDNFFLLQVVKSLRNACAHGNCILNDLGIIGRRQKINRRVESMIRSLRGMHVNTALQIMNNRKVHQIITTIYTHSDLCSGDLRDTRSEELRNLVEKLEANREFYERGRNYQLVRFITLLREVVEELYFAH